MEINKLIASTATDLAQSLRRAIDADAPLLAEIPAEVAAEKPDRQWSRKEELGHLIDSASNNHLRFVKAALEPQFQGPGYDQDGWVELHGYQTWQWEELLEFWRDYNLVLTRLIAAIPETKMQTPCRVGSGPEVSLGFLIDDYILHMQHHVDHILRREIVTVYPRPEAANTP